MNLDLVVRAHAQALVHRVVLAVDGQDGHLALARRGGKNLARGHHALLVGQAHRLAREDGRMRGLKPRHAHNRRDDKVRFLSRVEQAIVPSVPCTTSMPVTPASRSRAANCPASSSVASEITRGRQRTACAKASSTLRPAASAATE